MASSSSTLTTVARRVPAASGLTAFVVGPVGHYRFKGQPGSIADPLWLRCTVQYCTVQYCTTEFFFPNPHYTTVQYSTVASGALRPNKQSCRNGHAQRCVSIRKVEALATSLTPLPEIEGLSSQECVCVTVGRHIQHPLQCGPSPSIDRTGARKSQYRTVEQSEVCHFLL